MTEPRTRTDWKGRHDAVSAERDHARHELKKMEAHAEMLQGTVDELEAQIEDLKRQVQRARLEGARAATAALLECAE